jgi:hypothetical protein
MTLILIEKRKFNEKNRNKRHETRDKRQGEGVVVVKSTSTC